MSWEGLFFWTGIFTWACVVGFLILLFCSMIMHSVNTIKFIRRMVKAGGWKDPDMSSLKKARSYCGAFFYYFFHDVSRVTFANGNVVTWPGREESWERDADRTQQD